MVADYIDDRLTVQRFNYPQVDIIRHRRRSLGLFIYVFQQMTVVLLERHAMLGVCTPRRIAVTVGQI